MLHCEHRDPDCPAIAAKRMLVYNRNTGFLNEEYFCADHALECLSNLEYDESMEVRGIDDYDYGE